MANGSTFQTIMICHVLCARLKVASMVVQEGGDRYQVTMLMCILNTTSTRYEARMCSKNVRS